MLGLRLVKNHPLMDGNKRTALLSVIMFVRLNDRSWTPPPGDEDGAVTAALMEDLAGAPLNDDAVERFAVWIAERIGGG